MLREDTDEEIVDEPAADLTANLTEYFSSPAFIPTGTERFKQKKYMKQKEKVYFS